MGAVDGLSARRDERQRTLLRGWLGPASYDPYSFFSVFILHYMLTELRDGLFWQPYLILLVLTVAWVLFLQLGPWCKTPDCGGIFGELEVLSSFLEFFQVTLSLLLAFRLSRCAVRFYDMRAYAGTLILVCRELASAAAVYGAHDPALRDDVLRWTAAAPIATRNLVRRQKGTAAEFAGILEPPEAEAVVAAKHQPVYVLDVLRARVVQLMATHPGNPATAALMFSELAATVNAVHAASGAMERIAGTPLPYVYTLLLRMYISVLLALVLLLLTPTWGWSTIPIMAVLGWLLLGLEAVAVQSERPILRCLNHLPLEAYCMLVADNVHQTAATLSAPTPGQPLCLPWQSVPSARTAEASSCSSTQAVSEPPTPPASPASQYVAHPRPLPSMESVTSLRTAFSL